MDTREFSHGYTHIDPRVTRTRGMPYLQANLDPPGSGLSQTSSKIRQNIFHIMALSLGIYFKFNQILQGLNFSCKKGQSPPGAL